MDQNTYETLTEKILVEKTPKEYMIEAGFDEKETTTLFGQLCCLKIALIQLKWALLEGIRQDLKTLMTLFRWKNTKE